LPDIWKLRQHKSARLFRKWLSSAEIETAHDLELLYVESLEKTWVVESLPVRIIRFILTTGLGSLNPPIGIGLVPRPRDALLPLPYGRGSVKGRCRYRKETEFTVKDLGVVDSFFVDHFLKGYRPKMMFDRLSRLFPQDSSEMS
jgi:hypothetical protein